MLDLTRHRKCKCAITSGIEDGNMVITCRTHPIRTGKGKGQDRPRFTENVKELELYKCTCKNSFWKGLQRCKWHKYE